MKSASPLAQIEIEIADRDAGLVLVSVQNVPVSQSSSLSANKLVLSKTNWNILY